jgi:predicted Zn finger-like uncharacterized protein
MALATRCPHCATIFRVANDQLKLHAGIVRCGACQQTFNGIEHLLAPTVVTTAVNPVTTAAASAVKREVVSDAKPVVEATPAPIKVETPTPVAVEASTAEVLPSSEPVPAIPAPVEPTIPPHFSAPAPTPKRPGSKFSSSVFSKRPAPVEPIISIDAEVDNEAETTAEKNAEHSVEKNGLNKSAITDSLDFDVAPSGEDEQNEQAPQTVTSPIVLPEDIAVAAKQEAIAKAVLSANTSNMSISDSADSAAELHSVLRIDDDQDDLDAAQTVRAEPYLSIVDDSAAEDTEIDTPEFIRKAEYEKNKGRKVRGLMWALLILLVPGAFGQAAFTYRNYIAAALPDAKPMLLEACELLRCELKLPAQIDLLSIESNQLVTLPKAHHFSFEVQLQNKSTLAQTWPTLELAMTDAKDKPQVVKAFKPADYIEDKAVLSRGFAPSSEQNIKLYFELKDIETSSYRVAIYY